MRLALGMTLLLPLGFFGVLVRPGPSQLLAGQVGLQVVQRIHEPAVRVSLAVRGHVRDRVGQSGHRPRRRRDARTRDRRCVATR